MNTADVRRSCLFTVTNNAYDAEITYPRAVTDSRHRVQIPFTFIGQMKMKPKFYLKNGTPWRGKTHREKDGKIYTGETHTNSSKMLMNENQLPNSVLDSMRKRAKKA